MAKEDKRASQQITPDNTDVNEMRGFAEESARLQRMSDADYKQFAEVKVQNMDFERSNESAASDKTSAEKAEARGRDLAQMNMLFQERPIPAEVLIPNPSEREALNNRVLEYGSVKSSDAFDRWSETKSSKKDIERWSQVQSTPVIEVQGAEAIIGVQNSIIRPGKQAGTVYAEIPSSAPTEAQWNNLFATIASDEPTQRRASAPEVLQSAPSSRSEPTTAASSEYVQFTNATRPAEPQTPPKELSGSALTAELNTLSSKERSDFADQQFTMKFDRLPNISDQKEFKDVYQDLANLRGSISQGKAQEANQQTSSPDSPAKGAVATSLKLQDRNDRTVKIDTPEQALQNFQSATGQTIQTESRSAPAQETPSGPPPRPTRPSPSEPPASVMASRTQTETTPTRTTTKPLPTPPVQAAVAATAEIRTTPTVETAEVRTATAAVTQQPQQATRAQAPSLDDGIAQMQGKIREEFGRENDIARGRLELREGRANGTISEQDFNTRDSNFVRQSEALQKDMEASTKERSDFRRTLQGDDLAKFNTGMSEQMNTARQWRTEQQTAMAQRWESVLQREEQQPQQTTRARSDTADLDALLEELGRRSSKPLPPTPTRSSQAQTPNQPPSYEASVATAKQGINEAQQQAYDAAREAFQGSRGTAADQQVLDTISAQSRIAGAARVSQQQQQTTGGPEKGDLRGGGQGGYAAAVQANAQQQSQTTTQQPKQEQQAAKSEPTKAEPEKRTLMGSERMFKAFTANRFVTGHDGKVNDTYKPTGQHTYDERTKGSGTFGKLAAGIAMVTSPVANGFKAAMNFVGAAIKTGASLAGDGLKKLGELAGKPFEKAREMIDKPGAFNKIVGSIAMVAATPLKAVGMASSITGAAVESVGEVLKNACGVVGAVGRGALSFGTAGHIMRDIGSEVSKTIASVAHVATDVAKQVGTELKELGNQAGIPVVSQALRIAGASVQGVAQATEGIIQGTRKLAVGEVKEAAKLVASGVSSGAKTVGKEAYHAAGTEVFTSERRSLSGRDTTYTSQTRSEAEQTTTSGLSHDQRMEAARAGSQGAEHMRRTNDKSQSESYEANRTEVKEQKVTKDEAKLHKQEAKLGQATAQAQQQHHFRSQDHYDKKVEKQQGKVDEKQAKVDARKEAVAASKGFQENAKEVKDRDNKSKVNAYRFSQAQQQSADKGHGGRG
jgi:hypothetical protein